MIRNVLKPTTKPNVQTETSLPAPPDLSGIVLPALTDDPGIVAIDREISDIMRRLNVAEERERRAKSRARSRSNGGSPVGQSIVKSLLAGGKIDSASPEDEIAAAWEEQRILKTELAKAETTRSELIGELSFQMQKSLQELNARMQVATLKAAEHFWECYSRNFDLRNIVVAAGYQFMDHALPQFSLGSAHLVGDPSFSGGEAHRFRRFLIDRAMIADLETGND